MKAVYIYAITLVLMILTSCEREIDFRYHHIDPIKVIEAQLTPEGIKVSITETTPMDEPMNLTRLTDACVTLTDLTTGVGETLEVNVESYYVSTGAGIPGHDYRLTVDIDDCHYQAETEMYPSVEITDVKFEWISMPYDDVAVLRCKFLDNPATQGDCYWIKVYRNGEIYRWSELDDRGADDGEKVAMFMTTRRDTDEEDDEDLLLDGDEVTCTVSPISRQMHDYLEALHNGSNGPAMFSGDFCLGYFTATTPASTSVIFRPDFIGEDRKKQ